MLKLNIFIMHDNQNIVVSLVEENEPTMLERMRTYLRIIKCLAGAGAATSALTFGICNSINDDASKCVAPTIMATIIASAGTIFIFDYFQSFRSHNEVSNGSLEANPPLGGIQVSNALTSASNSPSPRSLNPEGRESSAKYSKPRKRN